MCANFGQYILRHTLCLDLVAPFIFVIHIGGGGTSEMGQQGWSGAGQRDYHYSLYNKRKFEEVL